MRNKHKHCKALLEAGNRKHASIRAAPPCCHRLTSTLLRCAHKPTTPSTFATTTIATIKLRIPYEYHPYPRGLGFPPPGRSYLPARERVRRRALRVSSNDATSRASLQILRFHLRQTPARAPRRNTSPKWTSDSSDRQDPTRRASRRTPRV